MKNRFSYSEAKKISIVGYLADLGIEPARTIGNDSWYHSPYREERTPSFKVNTKLNVWFDHGTGEGGTILDLGAKLHNCSLEEFLEKLSSGNHSSVSLHQQNLVVEKPESKLEVIDVHELSSPNLIHYLNGRGIDLEIAKEFCKEVEFRIGHKVYDAIGFQNLSGAFELRNSWFKGSSAPKDITVINRGGKSLAAFEGFMDLLSAVKLEGEFKRLTANSDFLVLNSIRLIKRSLPVIQSYPKATLFLDNDLAANDAKEFLIRSKVNFEDASNHYGHHKDVNEFLQGEIKKQQGQHIRRKKSRGLRR